MGQNIECTDNNFCFDDFFFLWDPNCIKQFARDDIIIKSLYFIRYNYNREISLEKVAKHVSLSRVYFCTYFRRITGKNFFDVLTQYRLTKAKELLTNGTLKISSIAEDVGYKSVPYFYKIFAQYTNQTPLEYRNNISERER